MKIWTVAMLGCALSLTSCNKHAGKDCGTFMRSVDIVSLKTPENEEERKAMILELEQSAQAWEQAAKTMQTPEVKSRGKALVEKRLERKGILETARFLEPKKEPPKPAPAASSAAPLSSAEARKKALAEAAKFGMEGLLGGASKSLSLPPEINAKLEANAKEIKERRDALLSWCQANE